MYPRLLIYSDIVNEIAMTGMHQNVAMRYVLHFVGALAGVCHQNK
jgi:hypothetical protein